MDTALRYCESVEKGFSIYIKLCLKHASRDFFIKLYRDSFHVEPFDEYESILTFDFWTNSTLTIEDSAILLQAIETLNSSEKMVIHLKFFQGKTDKEIAQMIGVTRQAISKSKANVLVKLKSHLEIQS